MPEFLTLVPPDEARMLLLSRVQAIRLGDEEVDILDALGRVNAEDIRAPHPLPEFPRSTVDGFSVRAKDTFGANESTPAYLKIVGEVPMGSCPSGDVGAGEAMIIHTGGMVPKGSDAVVMLEYAQAVRVDEIEVSHAVASGENVISVGEDVVAGQLVVPRGKVIRPAEIGGLVALGITRLRVVTKVRVGVISTGDEIVHPAEDIQLGQVRDINSYSLAALINSSGGEVISYGIVSDEFESLLARAGRALIETDLVVITAGSSASTRDVTAKVINNLGSPGVIVHGINTRPGKPTILGICNGTAVIGLPGNPVSALVNGILFILPLMDKLSGKVSITHRPSIKATLSVNIASQAGREDWQPVRLIQTDLGWLAEPVFGKSNLIFSLSSADGLVCISPDETGRSAGEKVDVFLI
jgi:molybdopterin molybdotransferase